MRAPAFIPVALVLGAQLFTPMPTLAQTSVQPPLEIVLPLTAGGLTDVSMRVLAERLGEKLDRNVLVLNKPGASGAIAARHVAQSAADGNTLLAVTSSHTSIVPFAQPNAGFEPLQDFTPVGTVTKSPSVLYVHPSVPADNLREFVAHAKANPGKLSYGTAGIGSFGHVASEYLFREAGVDLEMIPYQGGSRFTVALVAGEIDAVFTLPSGTFGQYVQDGKLKVLGMSMPEPSPQLPGVPPLNQTLPGFEAVVWTGLLAPAQTPPAVVEALNQAIQEVLAEPDTRAKYESMGVQAAALSPQEYRDEIVKEHALWQPLIQELGLGG